METIKIKSKNQAQISDASVADPLYKVVKQLAKDVNAGKGIDAKFLEEEGAGAAMAMFMRRAVQSAAVETEPKGFWKEFKGGKG